MGLSSEASRLFAIICRETQGETHSVTRARITLLAAGEMTEIEAENSPYGASRAQLYFFF